MKQPVQLIVAACLFGISSWSTAQWQWIDKDGRKVFSDRAPPTEIAEKNILKRPGKTAEPAQAKEDAEPATNKAEAVPPVPSAPSKADKDLEAKKKQMAQAEAAKRKAELERYEAERADNCMRAKQAKTTYESGIKIERTNAAGQREVMDDATRASEMQRIDRIIAKNCVPLPKPAQ